MSPAAAEFASACSAPRPLAAVVVVLAGVVVVADAVVVAATPLWPEAPQPAAAIMMKRKERSRAGPRMFTVSRPGPEPRLNTVVARLTSRRDDFGRSGPEWAAQLR